MITVTAKIGKGKSIHAMRTTGHFAGTTLCITNDTDITRGLPTECDAPAVTCKRCLKELARLAEQAHAEALELDAARDQEAAEEGATVPNTVEAWQAYAERVKLSRDAAEAEVASMVRKLVDMADYWERRAAQGQVLPSTPWTALRAIVAEVGS